MDVVEERTAARMYRIRPLLPGILSIGVFLFSSSETWLFWLGIALLVVGVVITMRRMLETLADG
ncbi:MAG: hypothetical protein AAB819_01755 [Patescibacteria group bacterium]